MVEFAVLRSGKVKIMNFRKAKFQIIKDVVKRTFWETALRDKGAKEVSRSLRMLSVEHEN